MFGEVRTNERLWRVVLIITMVAGLLPIMPTASQAAVGDTPPTWPSDASIAVSAVTTGSATLDWPAALDDAGVVGYRLYDGADALIDSTASTSYNLSGLIADTSYTVRVEAYDAGGNESTQLSGLNYGPRLALYAGNEPHSIDIADLNHDGDLDLAIAVRGDDSASILLGNGDGTFGSRSIYSVGTSGDGVGPKNLAFGYFNADGDLDIVSANQDDGTSGVILGNGDGSFGSVTPYVTSYGTHDVAVGDFNNDGDDDFMVVGWGTNDGTVWLGNGDGTFSTPVDYPAGSLSHGIVTADFDNDGDLDVATAANSDSAAASLRGNGDGSFQAPLIYEGTPNGWAHDIAMGDFDEDGDEDIVIAGENADNLSVFFGASGTTFSTNTTYSVADEPKGVSVGDLNDDGHDDLIATSVIQHYPTCPGGNNDPLTFWFGDGNGNFSSGGSVNVGEAPFDAAVADFNGDGWSDLAAPSWCDDTVSIFLNLGEGGPTTTFQTLAGGDPTEPGTPGAPSATAGDQVATVTWSAPSNGGSPILSYDLQLENLTTANSTTTGVGLTLSEDLTGLSNGDSYRARVRAANIVGNGAWSNWSANFIPSAGATVPGAPGTPAVSGGDAQLTAVWTVPGSDGGSAITSYDLQIHDQTADTYNTTDVGLTLTEDMTGLTNGNSHRTRVRATNSVGTGPWSGWSSSVIPQTTPDAPTTPGATAGDGQLTTTWSPPFDGGSTITSYDLRVRNLTEGTNTTTNVGLSLAETVTGLTNGNNYDVGVRAINSNGAGGWSPWSDTVVPQTVPDAPDTPLLAAGEGEVTVDWSQPFNGGAAITSYEVELEDESDGSSIFFDPGLDLTETVTGLVNGHSYRAAVRAENVNGWSDWSAWSDSAVPGSTPGAPGTPVLVGGAGEADAVWIAPGDDGGSAISGYEIQVENQTMAVSSYVELGLVLETTLTGLSNGETYRVRVRAINADGRGAWSDWSPSVVPSTVPTAPAAPGLAAGDATVTANWSVVTDNGGALVTGYQLEVEDVAAATGIVTDVGLVLTATVSGLSNGDAYRARVRAGNVNGWGSWSDWSNPVTPEGNTFSDDDGSIFEDDIEWLAKSGITRGCNPPLNDQFCPNDVVTRGQMAAFMVRALGLVDSGSVDFVDDDFSIFEGDIEKLAAAGITRGCNPPANDRFCPNDTVTRGQMAAFLVRALGLADRGEVDFVDDSSSIFEADIERLATAGIAFGCNPPANDRFCPGDPVTRGQMAAFLRRALNAD